MTQNDLMSELKQQALVDINEANDAQALQEVKVKYLGKKGSVSALMKNMKDLPNEEKPAYGQKVNELRQTIQSELDERQKLIKEEKLNQQLSEETIDVTLPSRHIEIGSKHPLTRTVEEIEDLFLGLGYEIVDGYEVEQDYYNFEALNLPKSHPARDMQDSFYITEEILMRTHTSPVQARTMEKRKGQGPVKIICPGKVYRRDSDDATHSHQFTQIEGNVCKHTGWIEILGAGMVHPNVLEMAGFDSKEYSGFAFGMGPDRIAMLKYGIEDIRHFYTNDVRFLDQFKAVEDRGEQ